MDKCSVWLLKFPYADLYTISIICADFDISCTSWVSFIMIRDNYPIDQSGRRHGELSVSAATSALVLLIPKVVPEQGST